MKCKLLVHLSCLCICMLTITSLSSCASGKYTTYKVSRYNQVNDPHKRARYLGRKVKDKDLLLSRKMMTLDGYSFKFDKACPKDVMQSKENWTTDAKVKWDTKRRTKHKIDYHVHFKRCYYLLKAYREITVKRYGEGYWKMYYIEIDE